MACRKGFKELRQVVEISWHKESGGELSFLLDFKKHDQDDARYYSDELDFFEFTSLLVKDGKEIYEGHRVKSIKTGLEYTIVFEEGQFKTTRNSNVFVPLEKWNTDLEIIGHIAEENK